MRKVRIAPHLPETVENRCQCHHTHSHYPPQTNGLGVLFLTKEEGSQDRQQAYGLPTTLLATVDGQGKRVRDCLPAILCSPKLGAEPWSL